MTRPRLTIVPCSVQDARAYVARVHRHHGPPLSGLFAAGVQDGEGALRGVAIVGRPVARGLDDGWTCEVIRLATDGCDNGCSALYGACWRAAQALGYTRIVTYILASEPGASLRGAGWRMVAETRGGSWSRDARPRVDHHPLGAKTRWEAVTATAQCSSPPACRGLAKPVENHDQCRLFADISRT